jgi:hypothetical protein
VTTPFDATPVIEALGQKIGILECNLVIAQVRLADLERQLAAAAADDTTDPAQRGSPT